MITTTPFKDALVTLTVLEWRHRMAVRRVERADLADADRLKRSQNELKDATLNLREMKGIMHRRFEREYREYLDQRAAQRQAS